MPKTKALYVVEVSGGLFQELTALEKGKRKRVIVPDVVDWDVLTGDGGDGDTEADWTALEPQTQAFIKKHRPDEYKTICERIEYERQQRDKDNPRP